MENLIYLDNAATSYPKPDVVHDFMHTFYKNHGVNPGRSGYDATLETEELVQETRKILTEFLGGTDLNQLTFSYNASDSLNMIIFGLVEKGDHVVSTNLEHNSVLRPLNVLQRDGVCEVDYLPFNDKGYMDPDTIKKSIKKNTKMVIMNHGSNVIGTVQPLAEIGKICKATGVLFVVDASQTAGAQSIHAGDMGIDIVAFTGHKCLMGPTGIGGSYICKTVDIKGTRHGGTGVRSAYPYHLEEFPYRMECGTLNLVGVAGLHAGQKWLAEQGVEKLHNREMQLWEKLRKGLQRIDGIILYCADSVENRNAILSFNVAGWEAADVGTMLDVDYNIACRTGLQCAPLVHKQIGTEEIHGTVRFSIGPFNTEEHIDKAIQAVEEISRIKRQ